MTHQSSAATIWLMCDLSQIESHQWGFFLKIFIMLMSLLIKMYLVCTSSKKSIFYLWLQNIALLLQTSVGSTWHQTPFSLPRVVWCLPTTCWNCTRWNWNSSLPTPSPQCLKHRFHTFNSRWNLTKWRKKWVSSIFNWCRWIGMDKEMCDPRINQGARCSSVVRVFAHGAMGHRIDPSWAISHSSQCSMTNVTKAVVCAILSVGWCI